MHHMLHSWPDAGLAYALRLLAALCETWPMPDELAPLVGSDHPLIDWTGQHVIWLDAIRAAGQPDAAVSRRWRQALLIASIRLATPAVYIFFGDSDRLLHGILGTGATRPTSDFQQVLQLVHRHLDAWAMRHYTDVDAFVTAFTDDWTLGLYG